VLTMLWTGHLLTAALPCRASAMLTILNPPLHHALCQQHTDLDRYAAALSQNLKAGEPLEVKLLGRTVVLFRDEHTGVGVWVGAHARAAQ
jgi:hypothetical protein